MNSIERKMLDALERGRNEYGVVGLKAEFEAEGTRPDELLRLLELARVADLKVALKIGGCEAVSDLHSVHIYGVDHVIAPMVETPYALSKYIEAIAKTHADNPDGVRFLFNVETQTTLENLPAMMPIAKRAGVGAVFGRVDFALSRGMARTAINEPSITTAVLTVARACADAGVDLVVGGSVSVAAIPALREIQAVHLTRFETRKVIFDGAAINLAKIESGLANAVAFELDWLINKRNYYARIAGEDQKRIAMMEERASQGALALSPAKAASQFARTEG